MESRSCGVNQAISIDQSLAARAPASQMEASSVDEFAQLMQSNVVNRAGRTRNEIDFAEFMRSALADQGADSSGKDCGRENGPVANPLTMETAFRMNSPPLAALEMQPLSGASSSALSGIPRDGSIFGPDGTARFDNIDFTRDSDGSLSEASKKELSELMSTLTDAIGGREVFASVFENSQGGISLELTAGDSNSVSFRVPDNLFYSAHTHPSGSTRPSPTDLSNRLGGEEAIVVDGQSYSFA